MPIDYSRYPANWKTEIVPRILERAGGCCEFCGIANGAEAQSVSLAVKQDGRYKQKRIWLTNESDFVRVTMFANGKDAKRVRVVLTVAHLDHDEENHEVMDHRLLALCQYCHLNYDAKEKFRRAVNKSISNQTIL